MARVKMNVKRLPISKVLADARLLKDGLTNNPNFPAPDPSPAELAAQIADAADTVTAYESSLEAAKVALILRNRSVDALRALMMRGGAHVDSQSGGSELKIASANLPVRRGNTKIGHLSRVEGLVLLHGTEGNVVARWKKVRGAAHYQLQLLPNATAAETEGKLVDTSVRCRAALAGLTSGTRVFVQVRAMGAAGPGPWSMVAWITVP